MNLKYPERPEHNVSREAFDSAECGRFLDVLQDYAFARVKELLDETPPAICVDVFARPADLKLQLALPFGASEDLLVYYVIPFRSVIQDLIDELQRDEVPAFADDDREYLSGVADEIESIAAHIRKVIA